MKFKTALLLSLLFPIASQAMVLKPDGNGGFVKHDCDKRTNSLSNQVNGFQELVHKAGLVGEESGRIVSNDPIDPKVIDAESGGIGKFCGKVVGNLSYMEHKGKRFLMGSAHGFTENGKLRSCDKNFGEFYPDLQYQGNSKFNHIKNFKFKLPPLNKNFYKGEPNNLDNLKIEDDIVILEIDERDAEELSKRQNNLGKRATIKLANIKKGSVPSLSNEVNIRTIGRRDNFRNYTTVLFEDNCLITTVNNTNLLRTSCDSGPGFSGNQMTFKGSQGQKYSIGMLFAATKEDITHDDFKQTRKGNYLISSEKLIKTVDESFQKKASQNEI